MEVVAIQTVQASINRGPSRTPPQWIGDLLGAGYTVILFLALLPHYMKRLCSLSSPLGHHPGTEGMEVGAQPRTLPSPPPGPVNVCSPTHGTIPELRWEGVAPPLGTTPELRWEGVVPPLGTTPVLRWEGVAPPLGTTPVLR